MESPPRGELDEMRRLLELTIHEHLESYQSTPADDDALRDAHAKSHGCVCGSFEVDQDVAPGTDVFHRAAGPYSAWVRFSNSSPEGKRDDALAARGMAVKLLGVGDRKLLDRVFGQTKWWKDEPSSQDLLLSSHPVFFVANVHDYLAFTKIETPFDVFVYFVPRRLPALWKLSRGLSKKVYNPLRIRYFSMTPYAYGSALAAHYEAVPIECDGSQEELDDPERDRSSKDYLREAMVESLDPAQGRPHCFRLLAWLRRPAERPPIEDATQSWGGHPLVLGTLHIPKQIFDTPSRDALCEDLSMTPWHATPEHQPLGGINRARLKIYQEISARRRAANDRKAFVPRSCP